jgi:hypothetical protein
LRISVAGDPGDRVLGSQAREGRRPEQQHHRTGDQGETEDEEDDRHLAP